MSAWTWDGDAMTSQAFRTALHVPLADPSSGNVVQIVTPGEDDVSAWGSSSGLPEAPTDSQVYGRYNATWTPVPPMTPTAILNALKTVDGAGSGLDADFLDGIDSSLFATITYVNSLFDTIDCGTF